MKRSLFTMVSLGLVFGCAGLAHAAPADGGLAESGVGLYIGGNVGGAKTDLSTRAPTGTTFNGVTTDEWDSAYKVFAGYRFHPNFAVEGGYAHLGGYGFQASTVPAGSIDARFKNTGWFVDLVPTISLPNRLSLFGRVGTYYNETRINVNGSGPFANSSRTDSDWNWKTGVGLQYDFTPVLGLRVELERYSKLGPNNQHIDFLSTGLMYRFSL